MKAELIEKLILAHNAGTETAFSTALADLVADEEKKGNLRLAKQLKEAYHGKDSKSTIIKSSKQSLDNFSYLLPSASTSTPRDNDSNLELFELVVPAVEIEDIILPQNQRELLRQMLAESEKNEELVAKNLPPANRLLLCGPPGCGKTMTAHAVAKQLGYPLAYVRLDGLVSSYLGQTSVNLRKVFDSIADKRLVLFLDEFDAIAKKRDDSNEMGELKRVVTALLQNFDNLSNSVFLIAATNHEHLLDPAIWRRFNYVLKLDLPKEDQRTKLIHKWMQDYGIEQTVDHGLLAQITQGMSPASIKELLQSAAKKQIISNEETSTEDIIRLLIQQLSNNADQENELAALITLNSRGISERQLAKVLGVSHTTLNYRLAKEREGADNAE